MAGKKPKKSHRTAKRKTQLDKRMEDFGEEVEALGKRVEHKGRHIESWWHRTFGIAGPFISAVIAMVFFFLAVLAVRMVNVPFNTGFLADISSFLMDNTGIFFLLFVLFSYSSYFSRWHFKSFRPFTPIVTAAGITACLWIAMNAMDIANFYIGSTVLFDIAYAISRLLPFIFGLAVLLGYIILIVQISMESRKGMERVVMEHARRHTKVREDTDLKRLYRSGKDKILGGVCGGLAEYFHMDPVIFRLMFVLLAFAWGFGILFYIICWIVIPRNPEHKWNR